MLITAPELATDLLYPPLRELSPPSLSADQLGGLRSFPEAYQDLRLLYSLRALEPLVEHGPAAILSGITLVTEILSALGAYFAKNPNVSLTDLRSAAALTVNDLHPHQEQISIAEADLPHSPHVVLLEAAEMAQLRRARRAGTSDEILAGAARMVLELWEFTDLLGSSHEKSAGELIHRRCWGSPRTTKILRALGIGLPMEEIPQTVTACGSSEESAAD